MVTTAPVRRRSVGSRNFGYTLGAVVDTFVLYLVNVEPSWQAVPFLTDGTRQALGLVNLSLAVGLVTNLVYTTYDPPWFKGLGDLLTTGIALALLVRVWDVFPFAFPGTGTDWAFVARVVLIVSIVGTIVGVVFQVVSLLLLRVIRSASGTGT